MDVSALAVAAFGLSYGALTAIPTGPVAFLILRNTAQGGPRAGLVTLASLSAAELIYLLLFAFGLSDLILETAWLKDGLYLFGGLLLIWIGVGSWRASPGSDDEGEGGAGAPRPALSHAAMFREGFLITLTNPALLVLYASLVASATALLGPEAVAAWRPLLLVGMLLGAAGWFLVVIALLGRLPAAAVGRLQRHIGRIAGGILMGFGGWLLVSLIP